MNKMANISMFEHGREEKIIDLPAVSSSNTKFHASVRGVECVLVRIEAPQLFSAFFTLHITTLDYYFLLRI